MKTLHDLELAGKKVLVRVDFNVPMNEEGQITDDLRIRSVLPTLQYLTAAKARVIICTHMGRPKGQRVEKYSLAPVAHHLSQLLGKPIPLASDCIGPEVQAAVGTLADGDILLLENLRFHAQEEQNDPEFSRQLASLADVYINDAFAVSHRAHASVEGVTHYVQEKAAGFLLQKEIEYFHRSIDNPQRPLVAIVGGAKVSGKLEALQNMLNKVDKMIIGGAMANTFLKSQGYAMGASKVEDDLLTTADDLLRKAREKGIKVYLPVDVIAADRFAPDAICKQVTIQDIPEGWMALDIGPASVICFNEALDGAKTIVWNGPMGAFEMNAFARGTMALAHTVAASHALSVTGGGDSNAAITLSGEAANISYMSTGGGAFLELMEGKKLPGVKALE
ncbi:phosphoglycerate kinase [Desulfobulbus oligotrophicus]|jgi:phosphoglycerate kinase|uniref:Phosphoglycerate kinase n=1 Tax=Desulfobulbus oligotrophicus TaxID=1909699 RepID=A0A7T6APJ1_9BACT|nr:phosphoglycerate kinase [Desulfobulbus oligotrophicus]MDY0391177.1 phosphoglycerate kinase [Desulfobulbus oligotrophicus]QQG64608.1 phosphoglycerate kinase [Desulfobulbus oligotrophicus]